MKTTGLLPIIELREFYTNLVDFFDWMFIVFTSKSLENPITYANVFNKKSQDHIILQQSDFVEEAIKLISCTYEDGTNWGNDVC